MRLGIDPEALAITARLARGIAAAVRVLAPHRRLCLIPEGTPVAALGAALVGEN